MSGALQGLRVIELGGKGPTPFAGMMLADMGADVTAIEREGSDPRDPVLTRGKRMIQIDLKSPSSRDQLLHELRDTDVLLEGFRPGVAERLGLGPREIRSANPRIVYGRMSGYGQGNSWSTTPGHDLNFIAMSSALAHLGAPGGPPTVPLNLVGDYGAGGMLLVVGVLAALVERSDSGSGQVVDAAMTDGSALLMASVFAMRANGVWVDRREANWVDGGAPFYRAYQTSDDKFVSVAALEPSHYAALMRVCAVPDPPLQGDREAWPRVSSLLAATFARKTREEWVDEFADVDASFAPVLTMAEVADHPYHRERGTFLQHGGVIQPAPAPRFERTPSAIVENAG